MPEYQFLGELGRGAMGVVLSARHRRLGRLVAVKELPPAFAADESVRSRFLLEGRTLAELDHPHVVVIHDLIDRDGHLALVMEQLPGGTVWDRFTTVGVTASVACGLLLSVASGLHHAHRQHILHRDVKPENLLFTASGHLKVSDFGMAKVMGGDRTMATADGVVLGTPAYMSPEQAQGAPIGPQADIYACGTLLHELLCGRLPFAEANTAVAMLVARVRDEAPPIRERAPTVPPAVADVVDTALARQLDERYSSIEDFAVSLALAAAASWGPEWLATTGVTVTGSETIERASRTSIEATGWRSPAPAALGGGRRAPKTVIDLRVGPEAPLPAIRGTSATRLPVSDLRLVSPDQMIDVASVGQIPQRPAPASRLAWLWLAALFFAVTAVSVLGFSLLAGGPRASAAPFLINGEPVVSEPVPLAIHEAFSIEGLGPGSRAQLEVRLAGVPVGLTEAPLNGGRSEFNPSYFQWTTGAVVDLIVRVDGEQQPRAVLAVAPSHRWWVNAPAALAAIVTLFGLASFSSNLKGLRNSGSVIGPLLGLAFATVVLTMSFTGALALASHHLPTLGALALGEASSALAVLLVVAGYHRRDRRVYVTTWV